MSIKLLIQRNLLFGDALKEKSGTVVYRGIGLLDTTDSWEGFSGSTHDTPYTSRDSGKPSQPSKLSGDDYLAASRGNDKMRLAYLTVNLFSR